MRTLVKVGILNQGSSTLVHEICTALNITEERKGFNNEHVVRKIETEDQRQWHLTCSDISKLLSDKTIISVLTKRVTVLGKTFC